MTLYTLRVPEQVEIGQTVEGPEGLMVVDEVRKRRDGNGVAVELLGYPIGKDTGRRSVLRYGAGEAASLMLTVLPTPEQELHAWDKLREAVPLAIDRWNETADEPDDAPPWRLTVDTVVLEAHGGPWRLGMVAEPEPEPAPLDQGDKADGPEPDPAAE
jgi:hypothetical protein